MVQSLDLDVIAPQLREKMERRQDPKDCWFCCGLVPIETRILAVEYWPDYVNRPDYVQIKFPGGTGDVGAGDNTPAKTLITEMLAEVLGPSGHVVSWKPFHEIVIPCREHPGGNHIKFGSIVELSGELRDIDYYEGRDTTEDGCETNERLGPPEFWEAEDLVEQLFPGHRPFLLALARIMIKKDPIWFGVADELANVQGVS